MKNLLLFLFLLLSISLVRANPIKDSLQIRKVYQLDIKEEIGPSIWRLTQKAFKEANNIKADIILLHINTYGGMVLYADSMRTRIMQSKIPVYAFIDNNAASAGALIAISCDSIYMRTGATIGAATVVDQSGQKLPDKYQSYMRGMMRSTAEAKKRNAEIAQAMVDPSIVIKGITDSTKVLTFSTSEAIQYGFCEAKTESIDEVMKHAGIVKYEIKEYKISALDTIIGWLVNPAVSGFLIMLIIAGLYFEFQTPGATFPIIAAATAAILYFAPLYLEGLAANWEIILFIAGLITLAVEIFVLPGHLVFGIAGIVMMFAGLTLSLVDNIGFNFEFTGTGGITRALFVVILSMSVGVVLSVYLGGKLFGSKAFSHLMLQTTQQSTRGFVSSDASFMQLIGRTGVAFTNLRPAGKVQIEGDIYDATAETGFIEKGEKVKVAKYDMAQLFVRRENSQ